MLGIRKLYHLLMGSVVHSLGVVPHSTTPKSVIPNSTLPYPIKLNLDQADDSRAKALITVFGMGKDGRIAKDRACQVVKSLGLLKEEEEERESSFDIPEEELHADGILVELEEEEKKEKEQLLRQAFMVFDEDGDGFIDAREIKRVLVCLGLDNGWDMSEIEKMIKVVDLNLDGKVDFHEFELMMGT